MRETENSMVTRVNGLIKEVERRIQIIQGTIDNLIAGMQKNPYYALEWLDIDFYRVAEQKVLKQLLKWIQDAPTIKEKYNTIIEFKKYALREVIAGAQNPKYSTSVSANLLNTCTTAAYAELISSTGFLFGWGNEY